MAVAALVALAVGWPGTGRAELLGAVLEPDFQQSNRADLLLDTVLFTGGPFPGTSQLQEGSGVNVTFDTVTDVLTVTDITLVGSDVIFTIGGVLVQKITASGIIVTLSSTTPAPTVTVDGSGVFQASLDLEIDMSTLLVVNNGIVSQQFDVEGIPFSTTSGTLGVSPVSGALSLTLAGDIVETSFDIDIPVLGIVEITISGTLELGLAESIFADGFESEDASGWALETPAL